MSDYKLIVGLGNPGSRYEDTRHNFGFMVLDALARDTSGARARYADTEVSLLKDWREKSKSILSEISINGAKLILIKPQSFMNLSGEPLREIASFYKIEPEEIIVVHDELDLPFGAVRIKQGGGDGGHNGLRSVTACLSSDNYTRLRMGIGKPNFQDANSSNSASSSNSNVAGGPDKVVNWVLGRFSATEQKELDNVISQAQHALVDLVVSGLKPAQNKYNRKSSDPAV